MLTGSHEPVPPLFDRGTGVDLPLDLATPDSAGTDDRDLVAALRRGDQDAFAALVDRHYPAMVRLARSYVADRDAAEDVVQDAWLGLLRGLDGFAGRASLKTWLFGILVNCARSSRRRDWRALPFSALPEPDDEPTIDPDRFHPEGHRWAGHWSAPPDPWPEEHLLASEIGGYLAIALSHLPARQRAVLTLRDIEGWPPSEICALFDISKSNERVLLHRARAHIRRELELYLAEPS
jgi:RNA polymerase sigma-70 factor (ECF subfamily)